MSNRGIGNYRITDYVGSGGFGSVFKAEDVNTPGRVVAIKELHKKHTRNSIIKQRFFQEAVAMARLDHPNLPRLYTFGEDNGSYYLVMEFISGKLLSEELHDNGPMPPARAVSILIQALEAVSYAHRNGIIHRDLKPDNIIFTEGGPSRIKVLDFGIARMVGGENLTLTGEGFGTPAYMSPERISGGAGDDPRIDIYSAGIILFEMLTGRTPFHSHATDPVVYWSEMRNLHTSEPLPSLASLGVSAALEQVAIRATAKRVEDRYASADELLADLKNIGGDVDRAEAAHAGASSLFLTVAPGGADVYVDDILRGTCDATRGKILVEGLAPGLHAVRVAKPGYSEYRISVSLEEGRQTDLQVALAARATVAMPTGENTAAAGFETVKFEAGDDVRTALLVVESLPAGSTLFVGPDPVARADEDGRATVRLNPGSYEVKVTAPTGATAKSMVTVSGEETGTLKTITIPLLPASTTAAAPRDAGGAGKKMAAVAVVALLLALAAAAYFVLRGPRREAAQGVPAPAAVTQPPAGVNPSAAPEAASAKQAITQVQAEVKSVTEERQRAQAEAEKAEAEKKANAEKAEAEKASADKRLAEKKNASAEQAPSVLPPPNSPSPQPQPTPAAQDACLGVMVTGGQSNRFRLLLVAQPESSSAAVINGQTNNRGQWFRCGFTAGHRVRIIAFGIKDGVKGGFRATREVVLTPGRNLIEIQASDQPGAAPEPPFAPGRRRPRFQRP
ncbi:MAG TPA: protein kinase [Blastocatellia bacterium]|nr:protein kinase [Blastocatellia bacterium]